MKTFSIFHIIFYNFFHLAIWQHGGNVPKEGYCFDCDPVIDLSLHFLSISEPHDNQPILYRAEQVIIRTRLIINETAMLKWFEMAFHSVTFRSLPLHINVKSVRSLKKISRYSYKVGVCESTHTTL